MVQRLKKFLVLISPLLLASCASVTTLDDSIPDTVTMSVKVDGPTLQTDGTYGSDDPVKTHWAAWITNEQGEYIKTLKINRSTPQINKYGSDKLASLPVWQEASGFTTPDDTTGKLTADKIYKEFDAVTAASLDLTDGKDTTVEVTWDLTDNLETKIVDGVYRLYAEFSALVKNIASINENPTNKVDAITAATVKDLWIDSIIATPTTATVYSYTKDSYDIHYIAYGLDSNLFTDTLPVPKFPRESATKLENLISDTTYYLFFRGELEADPENENHSVMGSFKTTSPDTLYDAGRYESQSSFVTVDFNSGTVTEGEITENILKIDAEVMTK